MTELRWEEEDAWCFLTELGLEVVPILETRSKTPEFLVNGDGRGYAVEVKARRNNKDWEQALRQRKVALQTRLTGYDRWAMDVTRNAIKQLRSVDPSHTRWWVLWLAVDCKASADAMFDQVINSLFGVRQIVYFEPNQDEKPMRDCIYAMPGVFERYPEIVAVIVTLGQGIRFAINELASDYASFCNSVLYRSFANIHPPTSATNLANNHDFFLIEDHSIDRRDERVISEYLERKYGLSGTVVADMAVHSASIIIDEDHDDTICSSV